MGLAKGFISNQLRSLGLFALGDANANASFSLFQKNRRTKFLPLLRYLVLDLYGSVQRKCLL